MGSIPDQGTKILHATKYSQKQKQKTLIHKSLKCSVPQFFPLQSVDSKRFKQNKLIRGQEQFLARSAYPEWQACVPCLSQEPQDSCSVLGELLTVACLVPPAEHPIALCPRSTVSLVPSLCHTQSREGTTSDPSLSGSGQGDDYLSQCLF